jgi:hypothetical protein
MPPPVEKPDLPAAPDAPPRLVGCMTMTLVGMGVLAAMVGLSLLSSGLFAPAFLAGAAFFGYVFFHYVVWGWWLAGMIRKEAEREEAATQAERGDKFVDVGQV